MSLLLDALKRAEQDKLARQGEASNDAPAAQPGAGAPGSKGAPVLELQPIGGAAAAAAPRADESAHAAQVMFDAKTPADPKRGRGMLWATLGAIAVVVGSAGAYVWYQMRLLSPTLAPVAVRRPPPPPLAQAPAGTQPNVPTFDEAMRGTAKLPVTTEPTAHVTREPVPAVAPSPANVAAAPPDDPVSRLAREAPAANAAPPLKLARTIEKASIPPEVSSGWAALRRGDLEQARRQYEAALTHDSMSLDARLGMATVEARSGRRSLAAGHYRRALEIDPRNATALAGLAALAEDNAPEAVEAQLREDVARFPESAALRFTLGTHYARQRRWGEAQAAFYEAHRLDPASADILYNLAVSLDHMKQPRLAAEFYRRAVEAAQVQPTQFDAGSVRQRLAEIAGR